ncbi:hypothetical protein ABZ478_21245 [Streptomyces sp. NPDC005706]|uniref:hypothetical protein n=1 Tax=Streptomyces sp. NPDC005706 TaxID=3157169 RepID=UPI003409AAF4
MSLEGRPWLRGRLVVREPRSRPGPCDGQRAGATELIVTDEPASALDASVRAQTLKPGAQIDQHCLVIAGP